MDAVEKYNTFESDNKNIFDKWVNNLIYDILNRTNQHINDEINTLNSRSYRRYNILQYPDGIPFLGSGSKRNWTFYTGPGSWTDMCPSDIDSAFNKIYRIEKENHYLDGYYITLEYVKQPFNVTACIGCVFFCDPYHEYILKIWLNKPNTLKI